MQGLKIKFVILISILMQQGFYSVAQETDLSDTLQVESADSLNLNDTVKIKNPKQVDDIINFAKKFLGTPYRYAG